MNIKVGDYIVVQKQTYRKLHKLNKSDSNISLGKDNVTLKGIEGCPYFSMFKMIPKSNRKNREYYLELTNEVVDLKDEIDVKTSGIDNRNILDDGRSQKLTATEIEELKTDANKASDIVETLISHSNTFHNKTEFSQEKYLRKKEKKYFDYLQVLKPNLRMIAEIMYRLDPGKIQSIRIDTLSQIITMSNIQSEGNYLLYDSGSNGLLASALLCAIGSQTNGKLIHMHPGNMSQKHALLAMNFNEEQLNRCISVNVYSALRQYYQGCDTNSSTVIETKDISFNTLKRKADDEVELKTKIAKVDATEQNCNNGSIEKESEVLKQSEPKKPKWHFENIAAAELLHKKMDALVIACKEDPLNLFNELVSCIKPGRPFVIYHTIAEPLQHLYLALRTQSNVAAVRLSCNWMRKYQILQDRTHPEVMMNGASGFLLTGYILK